MVEGTNCGLTRVETDVSVGAAELMTSTLACTAGEDVWNGTEFTLSNATRVKAGRALPNALFGGVQNNTSPVSTIVVPGTTGTALPAPALRIVSVEPGATVWIRNAASCPSGLLKSTAFARRSANVI